MPRSGLLASCRLALFWRVTFAFCLTACLLCGANASIAQTQDAAAEDASQTGNGTPQQPQPYATFREVLANRGVDASQLGHMFDDRPFSLDEHETLERTLAALVNLPPNLVSGFAQPATSLISALNDPEAHRGDLISLRGQVLACRVSAVPEELRERLGYAYLFRNTVRVELPAGDQVPSSLVCDVFSPLAPADWAVRTQAAANNPAPLKEPVAFQGVFLKRAVSPAAASETPDNADNKPDAARAILATRRLAWYPNNALGQAGFDVASLEDVASDGRLTTADAPALHGLLAALPRVNRATLREAAAASLAERNVPRADEREWSKRLLVEFMARPEAWRGQVVSLAGIARRAVKVHLDDAELRAAFGVTEYYEVEIFVAGPFRLPGLDDVVNRYPVTFCTARLPDAIPQGEKLSLPVRATGVFLKDWRYRSTLFVENDAGLQRVPLIIGGPLEVLPAPVPEPTEWSTRELVIAVAVFAGVLYVAFLIWRWGIRDQSAARRRASVLHGKRDENSAP